MLTTYVNAWLKAHGTPVTFWNQKEIQDRTYKTYQIKTWLRENGGIDAYITWSEWRNTPIILAQIEFHFDADAQLHDLAMKSLTCGSCNGKHASMDQVRTCTLNNKESK